MKFIRLGLWFETAQQPMCYNQITVMSSTHPEVREGLTTNGAEQI
jgi:hypothetical protein